jgi:TP901 family phage tail tape measure protein
MAEGESIGSLAVRVALDDSSFTKGMQNLKRSLGVIDSGFKSSIAGVKDWGKSLDNLKNNAQALGDKIEVQRKIVHSYSEQIGKLRTTLDKNGQAMNTLRTRVENTRRAYEQSKATFGENDEQTKKLKTDLNNLTREYESSEKAVLNNDRSIKNYTTQMNNAQGKLKGFENQLDETNKKIANFKLASLSTSLKESGEKFKTVGDTASKAGDSILTLSAPLVGIGVAAGKVGISFENSMSQAAGALNKPMSSMGSLRSLALKLGADTQFSATEMAQAMTELAKGGLSEAQIKMGALDATQKLAASSGMQLGDAANTIVRAMGAFGLSAGQASEATNALAGAAAASSTDVEPLTEALQQCSAGAHLVGWSIQDTTAVLGAFADAGIAGSDAGTSLKTMLQRLTAPTGDAAKKMQELGINVRDDNGHLKDAAGVAQELQTHMKGLSDAERDRAMNTIFGSDATRAASIMMGYGAAGIEKYTKATNDQTVGGRLAQSQMSETQRAVEQMKGSFETAAIKLETSFAPTIKAVADDVGKLADAFGNLSPGTQKMIVEMGGIALASGVVLKGLGGVSKGLGSILDLAGRFTGKAAAAGAASKVAEAGIKGVGAATAGTAAATAGATTAAGGFAASLGTAALAAGPYVLAIGGAVGAGGAIHHALTQQAIPAVDLFADKTTKSSKIVADSYGNMTQQVTTHTTKISAETKKAVGAYITMDDGVRKALTNLYVNGNTITNKTATSMVGKYKQMGTQIKTGMDQHYNSEYTTMKQFFQKSSALNTTQEQQALQKLTTNNNAKKARINSYTQQIQAIFQRAASQHRSLTAQEQQQVNSLQDKMRVNAVNSLSTNEVQAKVILQRMKDYGTNITAQQASSIIKNANRQRDGVISAANAQYNKTVSAIIRARDESHSITADQANKLIADAKRQRDGTVNHAENMRNQVVSKVSKMNSDTSKNVDTTTGNILTRWDKIKKFWENWHPVKKVFSFFESFGGNTKGKAANAQGGYAQGTLDATRGWHWVGEKGPELLYFSGGESVIDSEQSNKVAKEISKGYDDSQKTAAEDLENSEKFGQNMNISLAKGLTETQDKVTTPVNALNTNNKKIMDAAVQTYMTHGQNMDKNLGTAITGNAELVSNATSGVTNNNNNLLNVFSTNAVNYGVKADTTLASGITSTSPTVTASINNVIASMRNALQSFASSCVSIGQSIGDSIAQGMKNSEKNATDMAKQLAQKIIAAFQGPEGFDVNSPSRKTTWMGEMLGEGAIKGWTNSQVLAFFKNEVGNITSVMQGSTKQVAGWLSAALAITGQPLSALPALEQIAMHESGGNPLAVNNWDINAQRGDPSKGLMQIIGSNFAKYHLPGLDNIYNPIANAAAAIRYMLDRYGSIWNVPGVRSIMSGGGYMPYASGTNSALPGWQLKGEHGPELEYSPNGGETILSNKDTTNLLSVPSMIQNLGKQLEATSNNIASAINKAMSSSAGLNKTQQISNAYPVNNIGNSQAKIIIGDGDLNITLTTLDGKVLAKQVLPWVDIFQGKNLRKKKKGVSV